MTRQQPVKVFTRSPLGRLQKAAAKYLARTTAKRIRIVITDKDGTTSEFIVAR
jgi:hypothetical protein